MFECGGREVKPQKLNCPVVNNDEVQGAWIKLVTFTRPIGLRFVLFLVETSTKLDDFKLPIKILGETD